MHKHNELLSIVGLFYRKFVITHRWSTIWFMIWLIDLFDWLIGLIDWFIIWLIDWSDSIWFAWGTCAFDFHCSLTLATGTAYCTHGWSNRVLSYNCLIPLSAVCCTRGWSSCALNRGDSSVFAPYLSELTWCPSCRKGSPASLYRSVSRWAVDETVQIKYF